MLYPKRLVTAEAIQSDDPAFRFCRTFPLVSSGNRLIGSPVPELSLEVDAVEATSSLL